MTEKTVLTYGDMKQTFESLPERSRISQESWEYMRAIISRHMDEYAHMFYGNPDGLSFGWCMPSREGLYTAFQIPSRYLEDAPPTPVEEDSVFAPREVEVECEIR